MFGSALGEQNKSRIHFCQKHSDDPIFLQKYSISSSAEANFSEHQ